MNICVTLLDAVAWVRRGSLPGIGRIVLGDRYAEGVQENSQAGISVHETGEGLNTHIEIQRAKARLQGYRTTSTGNSTNFR